MKFDFLEIDFDFAIEIAIEHDFYRNKTQRLFYY